MQQVLPGGQCAALLSFPRHVCDDPGAGRVDRGVLCFAVGKRNKKFGQAVQAADKRISKVKKHILKENVFSLHVRVAGFCGRGGGRLTALSLLPRKLVQKGGAPPPEGHDELNSCCLLQRLQPPRAVRGRRQKVALYLDGNKQWDSALQALNMNHVKTVHVSHSQKKCVRNLAANTLDAGTQSIDARWQATDLFIGRKIKTRNAEHDVNPDLYMLMYAFCFRHNLSVQEKDVFKTTLGAVLRQGA